MTTAATMTALSRPPTIFTSSKNDEGANAVTAPLHARRDAFTVRRVGAGSIPSEDQIGGD
jgi:hypothetical protein